MPFIMSRLDLESGLQTFIKYDTLQEAIDAEFAFVRHTKRTYKMYIIRDPR